MTKRRSCTSLNKISFGNVNRSPFDENALTFAADQLTAACRTLLCIAASMVQMTEKCVTVMAPGRFRPPLVEVPGSTHLDAVVNLAIRVELWDGAFFGFHHVLAANLAKRAHQRTSSLLKKFFSAAILVDVVVPEPAVILYSGQMKAKITVILFKLDNDRLALVVGASAGQALA